MLDSFILYTNDLCVCVIPKQINDLCMSHSKIYFNGLRILLDHIYIYIKPSQFFIFMFLQKPRTMGTEARRRVKGSIVSALTMMSLLVFVSASDDSGLANECSKGFQSVMTCLSFAQGKIDEPSKECCGSVSSIKEDDHKCLCYVLQQSQTSGAQNLKSLGVQQDKLLQLPSACQVKNASVGDCLKLLGLAPNSPDAAIFKISSSTATASSGTPSSASEKADNKSDGTQLEIGHLVGSLLLVALAVFVYALPGAIASMF